MICFLANSVCRVVFVLFSLLVLALLIRSLRKDGDNEEGETEGDADIPTGFEFDLPVVSFARAVPSIVSCVVCTCVWEGGENGAGAGRTTSKRGCTNRELKPHR